MLAFPGSYTYRLRSSDADASGRMSLPALINLMQDAAWQHAAALEASVEVLQAQGLTWVLSRMRVEIDRYPGMGESITLNTWPSGNERHYTFRDFRFLNEAGEEIGRGTTTWVVLDLKTRRPIPMPAEWHERTQPPAGCNPISRSMARWDPPEARPNSLRQKVSWQHLDINQHVNQTHYVRWALAPLPSAINREAGCREIDLIFRREILMGDALLLVAEPVGADEFSHAIYRETDQQLMAQMRSTWEPLG